MMLNSIKNTLNRLSVNIHLPSFGNLKKLYAGLAVEFSRFIDYKNSIYNNVVPHPGMDSFAIDDYNKKYGIPKYLPGPDELRIDRIIEKANVTGFGGPQWLEEQVQKAGFPLYVHENLRENAATIQCGDFQCGDEQVGYTEMFPYDPNSVHGELIVGSPPRGEGRIYLSQCGTFQCGDMQCGTSNPLYLYPRPVPYNITDQQNYWGFFFFLSPFPDRLATSGELYEMPDYEFNYLFQILCEIKFQRNWCIAQVKII